jgi:hypothetical protein
MSDLSSLVLRANAAANALKMEAAVLASGAHRVVMRDAGRTKIASLTANVDGHVRYSPIVEDSDQTVVTLEWDVADGEERMEHQMEHTLNGDLPAVTTINIEGRCFTRALNVLVGRMRARLSDPHRVVLCAEIVGRYNNATLEIYKRAGFDVKRREFADGESSKSKNHVHHATMALFPPRTTGTVAASSASSSTKKRSRVESDEKKKTKKKKKAKQAKLAN